MVAVVVEVVAELELWAAGADEAVAVDDWGVDWCDEAAEGWGEEVSRCKKSEAGRDELLDSEGPRKRSGSRSESRGVALWLVISASPLTYARDVIERYILNLINTPINCGLCSLLLHSLSATRQS